MEPCADGGKAWLPATTLAVVLGLQGQVGRRSVGLVSCRRVAATFAQCQLPLLFRGWSSQYFKRSQKFGL